MPSTRLVLNDADHAIAAVLGCGYGEWMGDYREAVSRWIRQLTIVLDESLTEVERRGPG